MTDREKAIVMAYTGVTMLMGDRLQIFYKYVEEIMGRPIWTHEMTQLADDIKEKSKDDFMALCASETSNDWILCNERQPKEDGEYLVTLRWDNYPNSVETLHFTNDLSSVDRVGYAGEKRPGWYEYDSDYGCYEIDNVIAWMPRPEPYVPES